MLSIPCSLLCFAHKLYIFDSDSEMLWNLGLTEFCSSWIFISCVLEYSKVLTLHRNYSRFET